MENNNRAFEIMRKFENPQERSWYDFKVGKILDMDVMSNYAKLDNIITSDDGYVLMRFCCKGHVIDVVFNPGEVAVRSSFLPGGISEPVLVENLEEGLKLVSDAANESGV